MSDILRQIMLKRKTCKLVYTYWCVVYIYKCAACAVYANCFYLIFFYVHHYFILAVTRETTPSVFHLETCSFVTARRRLVAIGYPRYRKVEMTARTRFSLLRPKGRGGGWVTSSLYSVLRINRITGWWDIYDFSAKSACIFDSKIDLKVHRSTARFRIFPSFSNSLSLYSGSLHW